MAVTLRLLAGASNLDMIWYGVQKGSVFGIFKQGLGLINKVLPDSEIFNFHPKQRSFAEELQRMADQWSAVQMAKKGCNPSQGTLLYAPNFILLFLLYNE